MACRPRKGAKTIFEWALCKEDEDEDGDDDKNGKDDDKNGKDDDKNGNGKKDDNGKKEGDSKDAADSNGAASDAASDSERRENVFTEAAKDGKQKGKKKGNGNGNGDDDEEEKPIETDRPDFVEATTTVGRGRIQLEMGYSFISEREFGTSSTFHSYPETLWRIGLFADWFEFRIGWDYGNQRNTTAGVTQSFNGSQDLYLGTKLALTEQKGCLPETALILQITVPTGAESFSANQVLPGVIYAYGWDIIDDCLSFHALTAINRVVGAAQFGFPADVDPVQFGQDHPYVQLSQAGSIGYDLTKRLGAYTELFALFPHSAIDPSSLPEYYADGGFTYLVTSDLQLDIRAGVGLNKHADDFFTGAGVSVRY